MYLPNHFKIADEDQVFAFLQTHSFGQLISSVEGRLFSTHLPFLLNREGQKLLGHIAKQNPQHQSISEQEVLITFQGPHDYISPAWFTTPGVPTWNYQAVHVYGRCKVIEDTAQIANIVDTLTEKHESSFEQPWKPEYNTAMLRAIVGIEIDITEIQCKFKLSQNRVLADRQSIKQHLKGLDSIGLSTAIPVND